VSFFLLFLGAFLLKVFTLVYLTAILFTFATTLDTLGSVFQCHGSSPTLHVCVFTAMPDRLLLYRYDTPV